MPLHVAVVTAKKHKYLRVYTSYRNAEGKPRSRIVENHGRLDAALAKDPEYKTKLEARIAEENRQEAARKTEELELRAKKRIDKLTEAAKNEMGRPGCFSSYNVGGAVIRKVWCDLNLPRLFRYLQRDLKIEYSFDRAAYLLTEQRLLAPASKLKNFINKAESIVDHSSIDHLDDLYSVLDLLTKNKEAVVKHLYREIQKKTKRKVTAAFYDVTTYAFESRTVSELLNFGCSKDHKVNEVQVVLGLVMDEDGIPVDYELFSGNTNEFGTMVPLIKKIKKNYDLDSLIVVADRGLNSSENLFALRDIGCDFVIAQKFKSAEAEIKAQILDDDNWEETVCNADGEILSRYKTLNVRQPLYEIKTSKKTGRNYKSKKILDTMDLQWVVSYSGKRAAKDLADRDRAVAKAEQAIKEPERLKPRGYKSLVKIPQGKGSPEIDQNKIDRQAQWDGYYVICTNLDISPARTTEIYRKLWQIEDCFRVSKSQLESRPCFVWTDPHIRGHFLSCFVSLVIEKYMIFSLKQALGEEATHSKMLEALRTSRVVYDDLNSQFPLYLRMYPEGFFDKLSAHFGLAPLNRAEIPGSLRKKLHLPVIRG